MTSGAAPPWAYPTFMAVALVIAAINVTSRLIENPPERRDFAVWEPVVWELSSAAALAALIPLVFAIYRRASPERLGGMRFAALHGALSAPFSFAHVAGMVAIRHVAYAIHHAQYDFARGDLALELFYEWRKDALTYFSVLALLWLVSKRSAHLPLRQEPERLAVKANGRTLYLNPAEITHVEAAGNYVEIHAGGAPHLVRGALADYEARLADAGFVRIHRSRLVNQSRVRAIEPTPSGDFRALLDTGEALVGSRRFREGMAR